MKFTLMIVGGAIVAFILFAAINTTQPGYDEKIRARAAIEECNKQPDLLGACAKMAQDFERKYGRAP
jgi:hypothetical protein